MLTATWFINLRTLPKSLTFALRTSSLEAAPAVDLPFLPDATNRFQDPRLHGQVDTLQQVDLPRPLARGRCAYAPTGFTPYF
jgi:hypothetical protein